MCGQERSRVPQACMEVTNSCPPLTSRSALIVHASVPRSAQARRGRSAPHTPCCCPAAAQRPAAGGSRAPGSRRPRPGPAARASAQPATGAGTPAGTARTCRAGKGRQVRALNLLQCHKRWRPRGVHCRLTETPGLQDRTGAWGVPCCPQLDHTARCWNVSRLALQEVECA
jgi:hypothetical protein